MITQTTRYALSVLGYLARHESRRVPAHRIAEDTGTPANYVAKILSVLRRNRVVDAEKGWGGGYALRPQAGDMVLGQVVALFDDDSGPAACPFVRPVCGCYLAQHSEERLPTRPHGLRVLAPSDPAQVATRPPVPVGSLPSATVGRDVVCPYGAPACIVADPCPLHRHWASIREGFWGLAGVRIADLASRVPG